MDDAADFGSAFYKYEPVHLWSIAARTPDKCGATAQTTASLNQDVQLLADH